MTTETLVAKSERKSREEQKEWDLFMARFIEDPEKFERVRRAFKHLAQFARGEV